MRSIPINFRTTKLSMLISMICLLILSVPQAHPDVILPDVFSDNMVLQRGMNVPVSGTADPDENIVVTINGRSKKTIANKDGSWSVRLSKMDAGGPFTMTVSGKNTITLTNVKAGEVWLCSGQSNMWWPVEKLYDVPRDLIPADNPDIHLYSLWSPESESYGKTPEWSPCTTETLKEFSAAAYYFGRYLQKELGVPVGLIHNSMGGSLPEAWMTRARLESHPDLRPIVSCWDSIMTVYPDARGLFDNYLLDLKKAMANEQTLPPKPEFAFVPKPLRIYMRHPQILRDAQLEPLIPYGIRGVIFYQGESSIARAYQYRTLFPEMIREWRSVWGQGTFPFLFVQLQNYKGGETLPELREAQLMSLSVPNTGMAVTIDIGDEGDVHANNKWDVGYRLALIAFNRVYGRNLVCSGPLYSSMKKDGNTIRLGFDHIADGLAAKNGEPLKGFTIAGNDRVFYEARAEIDGNEIVVSCKNVQNPVAVRYGWESSPECNLYNSAWLPASPFRTDSWPGITKGILRPY